MTKKHEALNKAKQSGRKVVEGGKEFGKGGLDVVGGTAGAVAYTLVSGYEKGAYVVSKNGENAEGIKESERRRRAYVTNEHNRKSKEYIKTAGNFGKKAIKGAGKALKGGVKALGYGAKAGYHLIDAGDKAIGEKIEKKQIEKGKKPGKVSNFLRDNILKLMIVLSAAGYGGVELSNSKGGNIIENNQSFVEYFGDDDKVFIIDVSENNKFDEGKFKDRNEGRWNSPKKDVRGISGMYVRVQCERGPDKKYQEFYNRVVELNKTAEPGQKIAIGGYVFFDKHAQAMTDEGIEKQVDNAIESLGILNNENDGVVDLVPMLDFEFSRDPGVNSERGSNCKEAVLKRLQLFEQKTGIVPGIYTGGSIYHDYFLGDNRFEKYPVWIASYNEDRVDQSSDGHTVKIGPRADSVSFQPNLIQFTEEISGSGIGNHKDKLDGNTTTVDKFKELIIPNSDAPEIV